MGRWEWEDLIEGVDRVGLGRKQGETNTKGNLEGWLYGNLTTVKAS